MVFITNILKVTFIYIFIYVSMCAFWELGSTYHGVQVETKGQLIRIGFRHLPRRAQGLDSGGWAWWQVLRAAESSHWPW